MKPTTEVIRENLSPAEVLAIREAERARGRLVNVNRLDADLVEIEIIHPDTAIDVTPAFTDDWAGGTLRRLA